VNVARLLALLTAHLYPPPPPGNNFGIHVCWRLSRSQAHSVAGRINSVCIFVNCSCLACIVVILCVFVVSYVYLLYLMCICCIVCVFVVPYVYLLYYVCIAVLTLDAGLLARSQYPEGPATGHLDIGFSWFPCVY
jgi:hypothetical protein